jgi:hypothetical protein
MGSPLPQLHFHGYQLYQHHQITNCAELHPFQGQVNPSKDEPQTALFKAPVRTAL